MTQKVNNQSIIHDGQTVFTGVVILYIQCVASFFWMLLAKLPQLSQLQSKTIAHARIHIQPYFMHQICSRHLAQEKLYTYVQCTRTNLSALGNFQVCSNYNGFVYIIQSLLLFTFDT